MQASRRLRLFFMVKVAAEDGERMVDASLDVYDGTGD